MIKSCRFWFECGRFEGAAGGFCPPNLRGPILHSIYWLGNMVGRFFGPPRSAR